MAEPITEGRLRAIIKEEINPLADQVKRNTEDVHRNKKYLFGNGEPGLDEIVRNIQKIVVTLERMAWGVAVPVAGYYILKLVEWLIHL